jgi:hypothetical protein
VFAEFERETIIDRVVAGTERKAGRGEWVSGRGRSATPCRRASGEAGRPARLLDGPQPEAPSEEALAAIRQHVAHVMQHGPDSQRKAVIQALVGEVRVHSREHIVPTFYVPEDYDPAKVLMPHGMVDLGCHCANRVLPLLPGRPLLLLRG